MPTPLPALPGDGIFYDATVASGLDFVHDNGRSGRLYFVEPVGAGVALFDFDGDGDLDILLIQGGPLGEEQPDSPPQARLFRNDRQGEDAVPRFVDVTERSGLVATGYGMGVAVGDVTGNGCPDLYITYFGPNQLWRNRCDGSFSEVTETAGVDDPRWSTSATFFDFDGDGHLDLFVTHYVDFTLAGHQPCHAPSGRPDYCGPHAFEPTTDRLWRNRGDGTFEDVSAASGILARAGSGLGVTAADLDGDGLVDLYVANDLMPNVLWHNRGDGTFQDRAVLAGVAVDLRGVAEASMGVEAGDLTNDGHEDLFLTHLTGETNTLYRNVGGGLFEDRTIPSGLAAPSLPYTGFGTSLLDFDNDGWLDIATAHGAVRILEALADAGDPFPLHQANQLFRNRGAGTFEEVTARAGSAFRISEVSRGLAAGDVTNDGTTDLVLSNNGGPARLLLNRAAQGQPWLGARLLWGPGGRDAVGARVIARRSGAPDLWRRARADGSYLSAQDPRVLFGLGDQADVEHLEIRWPDGSVQLIETPPSRRYLVVTRPAAG